MSASRRLLAGMLVALALHAALAAGAFARLPEAARLVLAFGALVLLPGHGWLAAIGALPPGGAGLASGWALGFGVAWLSLQVLVTRMLHLPFTVLAGWAIVPGALPWLVALLRVRLAPGATGEGRQPPLTALALLVVLIAAAVALVHVARTPPPVGFNTDSPDHIGTIRRMLAEGDAFPADAFFRDAGPMGADPRKGLWHPCLALVARLAHADPLAAWEVVAALLASLFVLNAASFGLLVAGPSGAVVAAWTLLLTYGGSLERQFLREAVFATKLADQLALATATAVLADLDERTRRSRLAAVGLALGAIATHVFAALQFAVVFGALGAGLLVRERGAGARFARLLGTSLALALPALPYLGWRAQSAYAPSNIIHTEPQGLMFVTGRAIVVTPGVLWDWLGLLWVVVPLSWWAWARASTRPAVLYLLTSSLAAAAIMFCPPLVGLLQPRLGYLLMRFVWLVPLPGALAFAVPALLRGATGGRGWRRTAAMAALAALALLAAPARRAGARALADPGPARAREAADDPLRWRDALAWMDAHLPPGSVVLADPATSYSIPMMTRHWVTNLVDQHSSPNDSLALRRILDARDGLDPYASWETTRRVVRRWGATAIALNGRFAQPPRLDFWGPDPVWFAAARARFDGAPVAFRRVWDSGDFVVYAIDTTALASLADDARPRADERPWDPAAGPAGRWRRACPSWSASGSGARARRRATPSPSCSTGTRRGACRRAPTSCRCASIVRCRPASRRPRGAPSPRARCSSGSATNAIASAPTACPSPMASGWTCGTRRRSSATRSPCRCPPTRRRATTGCRSRCCGSRTTRTTVSPTSSSTTTTTAACRWARCASTAARRHDRSRPMCGINGVFHYRQGEPDRARVAAQAHVQRHRGPDDRDVWCDGPAALGQRRLSIVDLSAGGHQPMPNEDRTVWVTFNGELYHWPEVRPQLAARGHVFRGGSDTEMLLHLWEEKGPALVDDLRGMFAFGLFDTSRRTLMLARDRLGKKPLFWHDDGRRIVFASELKSLMLDPGVPREVDQESIADFLTFQYVPQPRTIYRGVHKLPPGHRLVCDANGPRVERYWSLPVGVDRSLPAADAAVRLRELLAEAVRIRLMSDVPLGAFLSGGVDSSVVVALMTQASPAPVKTFSIGFEAEDYSELEHARVVARHLGTDHHEQVVKPRALALLPRLVWGLDEPFSDPSMIPTYYVAEMARRHVTVALSGDGGDEAYAGYTTYAWARDYARVDRVPGFVRRALALPARALHADHPLGRKLYRTGLDVVDRHLDTMAHFPPRDLADVLSPELSGTLRGHDPFAPYRETHARAREVMGAIPALPYLDALTYMTDDVLVKVDRTSMLNSLEVRAPLLDHVVLEFVARLPFEYKLRGEVSKWILKECGRPLLPPGILDRPKQGFGVPLEHWFGEDFGRLAHEVLLDRRCRDRGWLRPAAVEGLLAPGKGRESRRARQVFTILCLELWAQTWLDRPREALAAPTDGPLPLHPAVAATARD